MSDPDLDISIPSLGREVGRVRIIPSGDPATAQLQTAQAERAEARAALADYLGKETTDG